MRAGIIDVDDDELPPASAVATAVPMDRTAHLRGPDPLPDEPGPPEKVDDDDEDIELKTESDESAKQSNLMARVTWLAIFCTVCLVVVPGARAKFVATSVGHARCHPDRWAEPETSESWLDKNRTLCR